MRSGFEGVGAVDAQFQDSKTSSLPDRPVRLGVFGCPPTTGNRGVDALRLSILSGLASALPNGVEATVFDYGQGIRESSELPDAPIRVKLMGAYLSRRVTSPANLQQMLWALHLGAGSVQPAVRELRRMDAVLDISGGDSFSDIYSARRFRGSSLTKKVTLAAGVPLILLPQTYGPYGSPSSRRQARRILKKSTRVWARDLDSLRVVESLLGNDFDPVRHVASVDVAFILKPREPSTAVRDALLAFRDSADIVVALNVSGLLFNIEGYGRERFGFRDEYRALITSLLKWLVSLEGIRVLLVPHVESGYQHDNDATACKTLVDDLTKPEQERVFATPPGLGARELKWVIGRSDRVCATRMHAAIAGISQGIPTVAIAYSDKTLGVFETAAIARAVVDPRHLGNAELLDRIRRSFDGRQDHADALASRLPDIRNELTTLFRSVVELSRRPE